MRQLSRPILRSCLLAAALLLVGGCGKPAVRTPPPGGGLDTSGILQGLLARTHRVVAQVGGTDSARRANVELQRIGEDYDDLLFQMEKQTPAEREVLVREAKRALPGMHGLADQVYQVPVLDDIMGDSLRRVVAKLELVHQFQ